jgi:phenol/toluene 2-monooxygenase (NADH) P0/A0
MNNAPTSSDIQQVDLTRKFVLIKDERPDGLVVFDFSIGWPDQSVELVMPRPAFEEFCATHQVEMLDD